MRQLPFLAHSEIIGIPRKRREPPQAHVSVGINNLRDLARRFLTPAPAPSSRIRYVIVIARYFPPGFFGFTNQYLRILRLRSTYAKPILIISRYKVSVSAIKAAAAFSLFDNNNNFLHFILISLTFTSSGHYFTLHRVICNFS
jgi:hypothetical protein